ncbi:MAG: hypothetical protein IH607_00275 [Firmicutes bacterium]|nr:hypothetical protein [Bacillota bacterium]
MFGYVTANYKALSEEDREQYRFYYCGLCRALQHRYGNLSRLTLNNDMTFLLLLLSSLYEPEEETAFRRCVMHPLKRMPYMTSEPAAYCADMTVLLAYLKALDDRADEGSLRAKAGAAALKKSFQRVKALYPDKVEKIAAMIGEINAYEARGGEDIDVPINLSGAFLGEIFCYRNDAWGEDLRALGEALGRFIYLMDAFDDLKADVKKGRYNALKPYSDQEHFETFCEDGLLMMISESARVFETLPLEKHLSILRNVLYSGVWTRYYQKTGACERADAQQGEQA